MQMLEIPTANILFNDEEKTVELFSMTRRPRRPAWAPDAPCVWP